MKRFFLCVIAMLFCICFITMTSCGKGSLNDDSNNQEIWACLDEIPETYQEGLVRISSGRQQYSYRSESGAKKFILEIIEKDNDLIVDIKKEKIRIGKIEGVYYVYNGEPIEYVGLDAHEIEGLLKIENEDGIIEWKQSGKFCRLYGKLSKEELIDVAKNVVILDE